MCHFLPAKLTLFHLLFLICANTLFPTLRTNPNMESFSLFQCSKTFANITHPKTSINCVCDFRTDMAYTQSKSPFRCTYFTLFAIARHSRPPSTILILSDSLYISNYGCCYKILPHRQSSSGGKSKNRCHFDLWCQCIHYNGPNCLVRRDIIHIYPLKACPKPFLFTIDTWSDKWTGSHTIFF